MRYSQILFALGTSKAPIAWGVSAAIGGSHDPGRGEKLNFLLRGECEPVGDLPLGGERDSNEVTRCNNDISVGNGGVVLSMTQIRSSCTMRHLID